MKKLIFASILLLSFWKGSEARIIEVDKNGTGDYLTIQEGVAVADSGDTVFVKNGKYIVIDDWIVLRVPICLLGESMDSTEIWGAGIEGVAIMVQSEDCIIRCFWITGASGTGGMGPGQAIVCWNCSPIITYNTFQAVASAPLWAVVCESSAAPIVHENNFFVSNIGYGVSLWGDSMNINAENNYWGTTDTTKIDKLIRDGRDSSGLGIVDYSPWLQDSITGIGESSHRQLLTGIIKLIQNQPNPFRTNTKISYQLTGEKSRMMNIKIYDTTGKLIRTMVNEIQQPGNYSITWDGIDNDHQKLPNGLYYYQLTIDGVYLAKKAVILK